LRASLKISVLVGLLGMEKLQGLPSFLGAIQ